MSSIHSQVMHIIVFRHEKKSIKINFSGTKTAGWGGGLPLQGAVVEKFAPSLESLFSFGFQIKGRNKTIN